MTWVLNLKRHFFLQAQPHEVCDANGVADEFSKMIKSSLYRTLYNPVLGVFNFCVSVTMHS